MCYNEKHYIFKMGQKKVPRTKVLSYYESKLLFVVRKAYQRKSRKLTIAIIARRTGLSVGFINRVASSKAHEIEFSASRLELLYECITGRKVDIREDFTCEEMYALYN